MGGGVNFWVYKEFPLRMFLSHKGAFPYGADGVRRRATRVEANDRAPALVTSLRWPRLTNEAGNRAEHWATIFIIQYVLISKN